MFLANISIGYDSREKLKNLSPEDQETFAQLFPKWAKSRKEDGTYPFLYGEHFADDAAVQWLCNRDIEVHIHRLKGLTGIGGVSFRDHQQVAAASAAAVHVHVPNVALQSYNEVQLLEDCCTDELQRQLDEGWRIIAVCPPNSTRRPDYILGRSKRVD